MTVPESLPGSTNELAKERTRSAAERTLSSWINNCILLIGFGVAIDQIRGSLEQLFPFASTLRIEQFAHNFGLSFILIGIGILIIVMMQHILILRFLGERSQVFQTNWFVNLNRFTIAIVLVFGLLNLLMMLLRFS